MIKNATSAAVLSAVTLVVGIGGAPTQSHAAGFFEQLFGIAPQQQAAPQPAAPSYGYDDPTMRSYSPGPVHHRAKRKVVAAIQKPKLQKPTDLMHDATLQTGDAVMMKGGISIYTGDDRDGKHTSADFEPLDAVHGVPKQERIALVAMDTTRADPLRGPLAPDTIASGRSASVAAPVTTGQPIVDARGKTVRYVGP